MERTDKELVEMFNRGQKDVFEIIVKRYQKKVYNTTLRMLGDKEDAADLAQEVFIKTYRNLNRFQGKARFSTWLFAVATNLCRDELRKRQRSIKADSLSAQDKDIAEYEIPDKYNDPEDMSIRRENSAEIQSALERLVIEQKEVIVLKDILGFSYQEIVEIVGVTMGTVKSRISRGRKNLKDILSKDERGEII